MLIVTFNKNKQPIKAISSNKKTCISKRNAGFLITIIQPISTLFKRVQYSANSFAQILQMVLASFISH
jgi:hypothetical protein